MAGPGRKAEDDEGTGGRLGRRVVERGEPPVDGVAHEVLAGRGDPPVGPRAPDREQDGHEPAADHPGVVLVGERTVEHDAQPGRVEVGGSLHDLLEPVGLDPVDEATSRTADPSRAVHRPLSDGAAGGSIAGSTPSRRRSVSAAASLAVHPSSTSEAMMRSARRSPSEYSR